MGDTMITAGQALYVNEVCRRNTNVEVADSLGSVGMSNQSPINLQTCMHIPLSPSLSFSLAVSHVYLLIFSTRQSLTQNGWG